MLQKLENFFKSISITPITWLIGISGILMVRFFLEALSSSTSSGIIASDASTLAHYYLFFLTIALAMMLIFRYAVPQWKNWVPQLVLYFFLAILLAPILDMILSGGRGFTMFYIFQDWSELWKSSLQYFGPLEYSGITVGIRIEVVLILIGSFLFIYKTRVKNTPLRTLKSFLWILLIYLLIFSAVSLPSIISIFSNQDPLAFSANTVVGSATLQNNLHGSLIYGYPARVIEIGFNYMVGRIWFLIAALLAVFWFLASYKEKTFNIFKNSRPERVVHYFLTVLFGIGLAYLLYPPLSINWNDVLSVIVLLLAFYFSWMFAVLTNDIADEKIDAVSNPGRPLVKGRVSVNDLKQASYLFLTASMFAGFLAGYYALFFILTFNSLYYIYSIPPTRFKTIPFFSSFVISLCCLSGTMAGFFLLSSSKALSSFPSMAILGVIVVTFLWSHIRDLKDIEGDRQEGVKTVAVLFGPKVVGAMAALAYLLVPIFSKIYWLYIFVLPASIVSYYFCTRKTYKEWPLFITYFITAFLSASLVLIAL